MSYMTVRNAHSQPACPCRGSQGCIRSRVAPGVGTKDLQACKGCCIESALLHDPDIAHTKRMCVPRIMRQHQQYAPCLVLSLLVALLCKALNYTHIVADAARPFLTSNQGTHHPGSSTARCVPLGGGDVRLGAGVGAPGPGPAEHASTYVNSRTPLTVCTMT